MQIMWSNKAVSETYEPGSTFKIVTVSAALESGVATVSDTFSCPGYYQIGGYRIRCHKTTGHGSGFDLAYGLQMSCNPCMITLSQRLGADTFYSYVKKFGYLEKTGIDPRRKINSITKEERKRILDTLKGFTVHLSGFRPIEEAIVTSGGVDVKEITPKTMESKICPGLYFAGEVIDVDAYTGGFNLQIAFSTGYLAGKSAAES